MPLGRAVPTEYCSEFPSDRGVVIVWQLFGVVFCIGLSTVQSAPWTVVRQTANVDRDIVAGLLREGQFDEVMNRAAAVLKRSSQDSDAAARATIDIAWATLERAIAAGQMPSPQETSRPLDGLIGSYPDHRRIDWLRFERGNLELRRLEAATALQLLDRRIDADMIARDMIAASDESEQFARDMQTRLQQSPAGSAAAIDATRLSRSLLVRGVKLDLLQTRMDSRGSVDQVAAASAAAQSAAAAMTRLPSTSEAAAELRLLRVVALYRASQIDEAETALDAAIADPPPADFGALAAMKIRLHSARRQFDAAEAIFRSSPRPTLDLNLAFLQSQIDRGDGPAELTGRIESIAQRHGPYAARLAESMILRSTGSETTPNDQAVLAMRAKQQIAAGKLVAGGRMMAAAAVAQRDPERAVEYATMAAAALAKSDADAAIDVLVAIATRHPSSAQTESLMAAAIQLASAGPANRLQTLLKQYLQQFATAANAPAYRTWLIDSLTQSGDLLSAAQWARGDDAIARWRKLFERESDSIQFDDIQSQFIQSINQRPSGNQADDDDRLRGAASSLVDITQLASLGIDDPLARFRSGASSTLVDLDPGSVWRLIRDGNLDPSRRKTIAAEVDRLRTTMDDWQAATIDIWAARDESASRRLNAQMDTDQSQQILARAAAIFAQGNESSQQRSVALEDQIASRLPIGNDDWHAAKWRSIQRLAARRDPQAYQRAQYILLTAGNIPAVWKSKYESITAVNSQR